MKKKFFSITIALILSVCTFSGCGGTDLSGNPYSKYYSESSGKFTTYGYSSPTDGTWAIDNEGFFAQDENGNRIDFRTKERYKEYLDCGLNTLMLQGNDPYSGEEWESSQTKKNMDNALAAGLESVIVYDSRIQTLSCESQPIYGEGAALSQTAMNATGRQQPFANEQELVDYLSECIKDYKEHETFIGVMLVDEPRWYQLPAAGQVYRALKKAMPEIYIQLNLLPLDTDHKTLFVDITDDKFADMSVEDSYEHYVRQYIELCDADRLCWDSYPFMQTGIDDDASYSILLTHFRNAQIICDLAKEYNLPVSTVCQSTELTRDKAGLNFVMKAPTMSEMYYQVNSYMGFGIDTFAYYTYWTKQQNREGAYHTDGTAFVDRSGEKTPLYYWMRDIHAEMQRFAPVALNFDYLGVNYFAERPVNFMANNYLSNVEQNEFSVLKGVAVEESQIALCTELKDEKNGQYMYMLFNPQAPSNNKKGDISLTATLDFGKDFKAAEVWSRGEMTLRPLDDGKIMFNLSAGFAVFVLPY